MTREKRTLRIGHTGITWADDQVEEAISTISSLGFHGAEIFGWVLKNLEDQNRLDLFEKYNLPLVSSYFSLDILNPDKKDQQLEKLYSWANILKGKGGKWVTLGGDMIDRRNFNFNDHKEYIVDFVNNIGKILADMDLILGFHPHTSTPIENTYEIEQFMDSVDTNYVGLTPDVAQIQKGGTDPITIMKKYMSIIKIVHLKDYSGEVRFDEEGREIDTTGYFCYTPLGQGVVDIPGILKILEDVSFDGYVMVELDGSKDMPLSANEAVTINANYLKDLKYEFVLR